MKHELSDKSLIIYLDGRIDSNNAAETEEKINAVLSENAHDALILDAEALEYLSSAGLRIILRLKKAEPTLKIVNVGLEVYEILDMTGFTEMMTVEKAYRKISVEGCEVIGEGANGKVYRINADTIVKVYRDPDSLQDIQRERELAKKAFVLGIPTAISYDVAKVGDGYGSVFELLDSMSFAKILVKEPEREEEIVDMYVDLLKKIHSTTVAGGGLPDMKETAEKWVEFLKDYLPSKDHEKLSALVSSVPASDKMMHGDYHLKNVMMQDGEALLIDMDTLCVGDPVFEFGSIYNAYIGFHELDPDNTADFLGIDYETSVRIWKNTVKKYFGTEDENALKGLEDKAAVIGYTRLMRRTIRREGADSKNAQYYKDRLIELLSHVNDLELK